GVDASCSFPMRLPCHERMEQALCQHEFLTVAMEVTPSAVVTCGHSHRAHARVTPRTRQLAFAGDRAGLVLRGDWQRNRDAAAGTIRRRHAAVVRDDD